MRDILRKAFPRLVVELMVFGALGSYAAVISVLYFWAPPDAVPAPPWYYVAIAVWGGILPAIASWIGMWIDSVAGRRRSNDQRTAAD